MIPTVARSTESASIAVDVGLYWLVGRIELTRLIVLGR